MSYPLHQIPRAAAARTARTESGFWGLDLQSSVLGRSFTRAAGTENLIWQGGALRVRPGYRACAAYQAPIHGIYFYEDDLIIHAGSCLYRQDPDFQNEPELLGSALHSAPSFGVVREQTITARRCDRPHLGGWRRSTVRKKVLFLNDGGTYWFYDGETLRNAIDARWGEDLTEWFEGNHAMTYYGTVPFTTVAKTPENCGGDVDPRGDNRLTQFRCESFYIGSEALSERFVLNCPREAFFEGIPAEVQVRERNGGWRNFSFNYTSIVDLDGEMAVLEIMPMKAGMPFLIDGDGRIVTLNMSNHYIADDGMDNVRITYAVHKPAPAALSGATVQGLYGADGGDQVLFLGGSAAAPGEDAFSAPNDFLCFYETAYERLGTADAPITGYCRLSDGRLAVLKNDPDHAGVYFRAHRVVELGKTQSGEAYRVDAYPSVSGAAVPGCVNPHTVGVAGNEPCFLASGGLFSVRSVSNELTNLNETVRRSGAVDPLLRALDPAAARAICRNGYYLLAFGQTVLITDGARDSAGNYRFLKWKLAHPVSAAAQKGDRLWFGSSDGALYAMDDTAESDAGTPINAWWRTPELEQTDGRKLRLKQVLAAVSPGHSGDLEVLIRRDRAADQTRTVPARLLDFSAVDFSNFTFDGSGDARWLPVAGERGSGRSFSLTFLFPPGPDLLLWGVRMIYEKGGNVF